MTPSLRIAIAFGLFCVFSAAPTPAASRDVPAGETLTLSEDLVLSGDDALAVAGTADKPCTLVGNNHQIRTDDNWSGRLTLTHCRLKGLGAGGLKPEFRALDLRATKSAAVRIEHCTFDESAGVRVSNAGESTTAFRHNTILANPLVPISKDLGDSRECFLAVGNSKAPKFFQGNRIFQSHVAFESPNWLVGGDADADSNLLIGMRVKITARGDSSIIRGNYLHVLMPRNGRFPYWSQVSTVDPGGNLLEHNVVRDGEWIVQFTDGEVRYNVICDINDHNLMRNGSTGKVHHNIFHVGKPDHPPGSMSACIYIVYAAKEPGDGMEIYNNTFDGCGVFEPPGVEVCEGGYVKSLRNNVFCNLRLTKYFSLPPAVVRPSWQEKTAKDVGRLGYADYNAFFNPDAKNPVHYTLGVAGKTVRKDAGFGLHDLPAGGAVDAEADPRFKGALFTQFPFKDEDIIAARVTVSQMLAKFRDAYTPAEGSPLTDAGDPADGEGTDVGAVGTGKAAEGDRFGRWGQQP